MSRAKNPKYESMSLEELKANMEKCRWWLLPQPIFPGRGFMTVITIRYTIIQASRGGGIYRNSDTGVCAGASD